MGTKWKKKVRRRRTKYRRQIPYHTRYALSKHITALGRSIDRDTNFRRSAPKGGGPASDQTLKIYPKRKVKSRKVTPMSLVKQLMEKNFSTQESEADVQWITYANNAWSWRMDLDDISKGNQVYERNCSKLTLEGMYVDLELKQTGDYVYTYRIMVIKMLDPDVDPEQVHPLHILADNANVEEAFKSGFIRVKGYDSKAYVYRPYKLSVLTDYRFTWNSNLGAGGINKRLRVYIPQHKIRYTNTGGSTGVGKIGLYIITDATCTSASFVMKGYRYKRTWTELAVEDTT